ncbi:MAG: hypothetical protein WCW66_01030 [Patescibacteria group bacterium]
MGDPKPPLPDEFNDPQIDRVLGDAEMSDTNHLIDSAASAGNPEQGTYREPADLEAHIALRDEMLDQYYRYKDKSKRPTQRIGENFEPAADLDGLLRQIEVVTDEWHRDLGPDDSLDYMRNEAVRVLELPLIQSLAIRINEIPEEKRSDVIALLEDFATIGDDRRAREEAQSIIERLQGA